MFALGTFPVGVPRMIPLAWPVGVDGELSLAREVRKPDPVSTSR